VKSVPSIDSAPKGYDQWTSAAAETLQSRPIALSYGPSPGIAPSTVIPLSVLDLAPIVQGGDAGQALANSLDLARHVERLGYRRFWVAEHHNLPGVASAATAVVIAHVAAGTSTIRVGAGGVMLPNHAPLIIAEQFGTLAALHPGRIDLGLGRAPGTDPITARALRRTLDAADTFPADVVELMRYFDPPAPGQVVRAIPGAGLEVPIWILGSSLFGAELAARLGLPFAFASHFAPAMLGEAIDRYRSRFTPSSRPGASTEPYLMLGVNVVAAETEVEARLLATSLLQAFLNIRRGHPTQLPPPREGVESELTPWELEMLRELLACSFIGDPGQVGQGLAEFVAATGADELMVASAIFDHRKRLRSYELLAGAAEVSLAGSRSTGDRIERIDSKSGVKSEG
jgi:luciferase family oxidoreductase group 1